MRVSECVFGRPPPCKRLAADGVRCPLLRTAPARPGSPMTRTTSEAVARPPTLAVAHLNPKETLMQLIRLPCVVQLCSVGEGAMAARSVEFRLLFEPDHPLFFHILRHHTSSQTTVAMRTRLLFTRSPLIVGADFLRRELTSSS